MKMNKKLKHYLVASLILLLAACDSGGGVTSPIDLSKSLKLNSYTSCAELEMEVKEMLIGQMEQNLEGMKKYCYYGEPIPLAEPADGGSFAEGSNAAETTGTNLQESDVDEADLIKSDGTYAYAIVKDEVQIVKVWPFEDFNVLVSIAIEGEPRGLYVLGEKLIMLSVKSEDSFTIEPMYSVPASKAVTVQTIYDISDQSNPKLLKSSEYVGNLISSRLIGTKLYIILSDRGAVAPEIDYYVDVDYASLPSCEELGEDEVPQALEIAVEDLKSKNRKIIEDTSLADLMPVIGRAGGLECTQIQRSAKSSGTELLIVAVSDIGTAETSAMTAVFAGGGAVYASLKNLFISSSSVDYGWWGVSDYEFKDASIIHRFNIEGKSPVYKGSVEIEGHLVDNSYAGSHYSSRFSMAQFAMSEHEGHLRVATTVNYVSAAGSNTDNRVYVVKVDNDGLETIGEVKGLGQGERIYSVRFIGERGYVVTFKKVDPLYVLDLSIPTSPVVLGELKIPGFSSYLHQFGENYLIGLGFGSDDEVSFAWTQGLKLALFDVSNPANPIEVGHREIGARGSYSAAIEEHHAFTLDESKGLLSLPVDIYEGGSGGSEMGSISFTGVMLFNVDEAGSFTTEGSIAVKPSYEQAYPEWWGYQDSEALRTIIIGDESEEGIITLTKQGVMLNKIDESMTEMGRTF